MLPPPSPVIKPSAHAKLSRKAGDIIQDPHSESEDVTFGYFWVTPKDQAVHVSLHVGSCLIIVLQSSSIDSCSKEGAMAFNTFSSLSRFDAKEGLDLKDALS